MQNDNDIYSFAICSNYRCYVHVLGLGTICMVSSLGIIVGRIHGFMDSWIRVIQLLQLGGI